MRWALAAGYRHIDTAQAYGNEQSVGAGLRDSGVPLLAVWGRNDQIFVPEGALAFAGDAPGAEIHLLDGGHFLLESQLDAAAGSIRRFLGRTLP